MRSTTRDILTTPLSSKRKQQQQQQQQKANLCSFKLNKNDQDELNEDSFYALNMPKKFKFSPVVKLDNMPAKHKLKRQQQSFTFIADFASTSTPTRSTQQPIASTPKKSSHDPLKYHPTQTIRNKSKKLSIKKVKKIIAQPAGMVFVQNEVDFKNRKTFSSELNLDCLKYKKAEKHKAKSKHRLAAELERHYDTKKYQQQLNEYIKMNQLYKSKKSGDAKSHKHKSIKRKLSSESLVSSSTSINSCENCNLCNQNKKLKSNSRKEHSSTRISSINKVRTIKIKNNFGISLEDLLYSPAKIKNLDINSTTTSAVAVKSAPAVPVQGSKVYYL